MDMSQAKIEKLEVEKRSANEGSQSVAPPSLSVGSFGMDNLMETEEDTVQQTSAQARKQSSVIQSSKVGNKLEARSRHDLY